MTFENNQERDRRFQELEKELTAEGRRLLDQLHEGGRPLLSRLEAVLTEALISHGFLQVSTPILLSRGLLEKMTIDSAHPLNSQVFWVDRRRCLRPMLAPNLYVLMGKLARLWAKPFRIFEIGSCFRSESTGSHHLDEFTMLNLVEVGLEPEIRQKRMEELSSIVMRAAGIEQYSTVSKASEVYGETIDIITVGMEVCSGAMGPHPLDDAWGIKDTWVGLGFGLERLLMAREGYASIHRAGRSLAYINGVHLNL